MTTPLITMVGSLNMDMNLRVPHMPAPGETLLASDLHETPGGKSSNQAAAAARLGARVRLIGAVGDDSAGRALRHHVETLGVDSTYLRTVDGVPTGRAVIQVDAAGENIITVIAGANEHLEPGDITEPALAQSSIVSLALEVPLDTVLKAARAAKAIGARTVLNLSPFQPVPDELLALTDVLLLNQHEASQFMGRGRESELDCAALSEKLAILGAKAAVVTLGDLGAEVVQVGGMNEPVITERVPGFRVDAVDTTGCGDAFAGALAQQLAMGESLTTAVRVANAAGGFAAERRGAQSSYPSKEELAQWTARKRNEVRGAARAVA